MGVTVTSEVSDSHRVDVVAFELRELLRISHGHFNSHCRVRAVFDLPQEANRICNFKSIAPVEELQRVQSPLAAQRLVNSGQGSTQSCRENPDTQSQFRRSVP